MANYDAPKFKEFCEAYERGEPTRATAERIVLPGKSIDAAHAAVRGMVTTLIAFGVLERRAVSIESLRERAARMREKHAAELAEFRAWKASRSQRSAAE